MITAAYRWIDRNILELGREMRLSYLPPLMVYIGAGISGLTGIVGTFFVKDYLGLSAAFLAAIGFWAGIPWVLKMPLGHLVDLIWRWKSLLVYLGASLITVGLLIMVFLIGEREAMTAIMPAEAWFVVSALLSPIGYVIQDAVADAMTVEAVPRVDEHGRPIDRPPASSCTLPCRRSGVWPSSAAARWWRSSTSTSSPASRGSRRRRSRSSTATST